MTCNVTDIPLADSALAEHARSRHPGGSGRANRRESLNGLLDSAGDPFIERRHVSQRRLCPLDLFHWEPSL